MLQRCLVGKQFSFLSGQVKNSSLVKATSYKFVLESIFFLSSEQNACWCVAPMLRFVLFSLFFKNYKKHTEQPSKIQSFLQAHFKWHKTQTLVCTQLIVSWTIEEFPKLLHPTLNVFFFLVNDCYLYKYNNCEVYQMSRRNSCDPSSNSFSPFGTMWSCASILHQIRTTIYFYFISWKK